MAQDFHMTTRRDIIKGSLGLAGIIAVGKAPAALIKSNLAARNAMMAGGGLSAKDYPEMPDIAMWDGIENAGWGIHDTNANTWKNLINGSDSPFVGTGAYFTDNHFRSGTSGGGVNIGLYPSCNTVEIVVARFSGSYQVVSPTKRTNTTQRIIIYVSNVGYVPNAANSGNRVQFADYTIPHSVVFSFVGGSAKTYGDGVESTAAKYNDYWSVDDGYIARSSFGTRHSDIAVYSLRLHSRALTAAEISANYAVDKARFNLP